MSKRVKCDANREEFIVQLDLKYTAFFSPPYYDARDEIVVTSLGELSR